MRNLLWRISRWSACFHIWFVEQSLSNALRLETYIEDAERDGDSEPAEFFKRAQAANRNGGEPGKELLSKRLTA
jgi:hypothetical protein